MSEYFKDKVVIVTGGSNGIAASIVSLCLENGAKVASLDILDTEATTNDSLLSIYCDVSSEDACNNAVKQVVEKWGMVDVLVNCAAVMDNMAGIKGGDAGVAYTTSKHAIIGLTKSTAWMYAKEGIRCNVLIPGGVRTNILENSKAKLDPVGSKVLYPIHQTMPGWLEPIDVARAVVFLAGATGVNGAQWTIDHGWSVA